METDMKRNELLQAALSFVPQHGWTKQSLSLGSGNFYLLLFLLHIVIYCCQCCYY